MNDEIKITLKALVEKLDYIDDDRAFRWFQDSVVNPDGSIRAIEHYVVTMGQARAELGVVRRSNA